MPNPNSEEDVVGASLDLAWSLWTELGVRGTIRRHADRAIDLEPLILHTAWLGNHDRRLWAEALDWCVTNSSLVSATRLKRLLAGASQRVSQAFGQFAATVKTHTSVAWPGIGTPSQIELSRKSLVAPVDRAAAIQLRLRAIFGVSARAEVLHWMLSEPARQWSISELVDRTSHGKPNITETLELLRRSGLVTHERRGNAGLFSLVAAPQLAALVGELPTTYPRWPAVFAVVESLVDYKTKTGVSPASALAELAATIAELPELAASFGALRRIPVASTADLVPRFDNWAAKTVASWAAPSTATAMEQTYSIQRLELPRGAWIGVVATPGQEVHSIQMPEWEGLYQEQPRSDTIISDDSTGAPRLAHEMMRMAAARAGHDIGDYWSGGSGPADFGINQLIAREFAEERLWPMRNGSSASWTESFMRAWRQDRIDRFRARKEAQQRQIIATTSGSSLIPEETREPPSR